MLWPYALGVDFDSNILLLFSWVRDLIYCGLGFGIYSLIGSILVWLWLDWLDLVVVSRQ